MRAAKFVHTQKLKSLALFPRHHPAVHHLQYVLPVKESWVETWEQVLNVNQNPCLPMLWSISEQILFASGACLPYVAYACTKLHAMCDHYLTESTCNKLCLLRIAELKIAQEVVYNDTTSDCGHTALKFLAMALQWVIISMVRWGFWHPECK